jgi:glycosyltransferase involved in cell wall biosynthesis
MIPKIIHYCWFSKDRTAPLPEKVQQCVASWRKYCPDWEIKLWNEDNFDLSMNSFAREAYEAGKMGFATDFIRTCLLYTHGGVYMDADMELLQSIDFLLENRAFTGIENAYSKPDGSHDFSYLGSGLLGSEKGHPYFKAVMDFYEKQRFANPDGSLNMWCTSNHAYSKVAVEMYGMLGRETQTYGDGGGALTVYCKDVMYPHDRSCAKPENISLHHSMATWITPVSVVMPARNGALYIREAIDSVLAQTLERFELIIVDNASTDDTAAIAGSYRSNKIRLLRREVNDLSEALNDGIRAATGRYIARLDADDAMHPERLARQYAVMERYPAAAVCCSSYLLRRSGEPPCSAVTLREGFIERPLEALLRGNIVAHPTVMLRKEFLWRNGLRYEDYPRAEDYKLWLEVAKRGGGFYAAGDALTTYRLHPAMTTVVHREEQIATSRKIQDDAAAYLSPASRLTVAIPFCNEGEEVWRTVFSLRGKCSRNVQVILINDASTDGYDYESIARATGSRYVKNAERAGVAGSREVGAALAETDYFLLLDAHCKLYTPGWDELLVGLLDENPESLICCATRALGAGRVAMPVNMGFGASLTESASVAWRNNRQPGDVVEVEAVLGAAYACSKAYWQRLHGLQGLREYGFDEEFISLKVHAAGGRVLCAQHVEVGHIFRSKFPYHVSRANGAYNEMLTATLLAPADVKRRMLKKNAAYNKGAFADAKKMLKANAAWVAQEKEYLHSIFLPNWEDAVRKKIGS